MVHYLASVKIRILHEVGMRLHELRDRASSFACSPEHVTFSLQHDIRANKSGEGMSICDK